MNNTPNGNRKHIVILGKTNSGKSSLINRLVGQDVALVSEMEGTTTDPVQKAMELLPVGPVVFIDTAGLCDKTDLGDIRVKKTYEYMKRADIAIYVADVSEKNDEAFLKAKKLFLKYNIPYITVYN